MILLKLHIAIGILLFIVHIGNTTLFGERMSERLNYIKPSKKKASIFRKGIGHAKVFLSCMIPIYNICIIVTELIVMFATDDVLDKLKEKKEEGIRSDE